MRVLVTHGHPTMLKYRSPHLGRLIQPRHYSSIEATAEEGIAWAADNDCFQGLDPTAFVKMLDRIEGLPGCLFVSTPDVVGDHAETIQLFRRWAPELRYRDLPIAFVLQNGCTLAGVPWTEVDALFVGGDNDFKLGEVAAEIVRQAKRYGLYAHMGRVNSWKRTKYAASIGCDSIDGTRNSMFVDRYLETSIHDVERAAKEVADESTECTS